MGSRSKPEPRATEVFCIHNTYSPEPIATEISHSERSETCSATEKGPHLKALLVLIIEAEVARPENETPCNNGDLRQQLTKIRA